MEKETLGALVRILRKYVKYKDVSLDANHGSDWHLVAKWAVDHGADLNQV